MTDETPTALEEVGQTKESAAPTSWDPGPLPYRLGGWPCIVADPPWPYDDQGPRLKLPYDAMELADIWRMPIDHLSSDKGHLYLWTVDAHLEFSLELVRHWGFDFKRTIAWVKTTLDGSKLRFGGGHTVRGAHELVLLCSRGKLSALVHDVPSVIFAPRTKHSRKPDELLEIAERMSPGPRVELFARRARPGWVAWGNQAPQSPSVPPCECGRARDVERSTGFLECAVRVTEIGHSSIAKPGFMPGPRNAE